MPLSSTQEPMELVDTAPWSVGFWMQVEGGGPSERIWVQPTYFCILGLDTSRAIDRDSACQTAETNRTRIEAAASEKFDSKGPVPEDGERERRPILILRARDISNATSPTLKRAIARAAE